MATTADTVKLRPVVLSIVVFMLFFLGLPIMRFFDFLPVVLLPAGKWLYVSVALFTCVAIASVDQPPSIQRRVALTVAASLLSCVLLATGALAALDWLFGFSDFATVEVVSDSAATSGRLRLVHEYRDVGAFGGSDVVFVKGRLIPGVIEWNHRLPVTAASSVSWRGNDSVQVDGTVYRVPRALAFFAW